MFEPQKNKYKKTFFFNNEMYKGFENIKNHFKETYNVEPSNMRILNVLIKDFNIKNVERVSRSKKDFRIKM